MGNARKRRSIDEFARTEIRPAMISCAESVYNAKCDERRRELVRRGVLVPVANMFDFSLSDVQWHKQNARI